MVRSLKSYALAAVVALILFAVFLILAFENFSVVYNILFIVATVACFLMYNALIYMQMTKCNTQITQIIMAARIDNTELYNCYEFVKNNKSGFTKQIKMTVYMYYCYTLIMLKECDMAREVIAEFEKRFYKKKYRYSNEKVLILYSYYFKISLAMLSNDVPTAKQNLVKIQEVIETIGDSKTLVEAEYFVSLATCKIDLTNKENARKWLDYLLASPQSIIQYNHMVKLLMRGYAMALLGENENALKDFKVVVYSEVSLLLTNKAQLEIEKLNNNGCPYDETKLECDVVEEDKIDEDFTLKNEDVKNDSMFYETNSSVFYKKKIIKKADVQNDDVIIELNFFKRNMNYLLFLGMQLVALGLGILLSFNMNSKLEGFETNVIMYLGFSIILVALVSGMVLLYSVFDKVLHMSQSACIGLSIVTSFIGYIPGAVLALPMTVTAIIMMFLTKKQIYATQERRECKRNSIFMRASLIMIIGVPILLSLFSLL